MHAGCTSIVNLCWSKCVERLTASSTVRKTKTLLLSAWLDYGRTLAVVNRRVEDPSLFPADHSRLHNSALMQNCSEQTDARNRLMREQLLLLADRVGANAFWPKHVVTATAATQRSFL
jgi:hypothetical protein